MTILNEIQKILDEKDVPSFTAEPTVESPYERILVATPGGEGEELLPLEISAHPQFFERTTIDKNLSDTYHLIQFQSILPLPIPPENFNQVSSALHFFNRLLHCPGFELDELSDSVVYRYVWFIKDTGIDSFLVMQVLGSVQLCSNMFSRYIKEIAEGKYTLEDILENVIQLSKQQAEAHK